MNWKAWVVIILAAFVLGFGIAKYGFDTPPPPIVETDPHKQPAPGP